MKLPSLASGDKVGVKSVDKEIVMAKWQLETRRDTIFESERPGIKDFKSINFMMHLIEGNESKWWSWNCYNLLYHTFKINDKIYAN